jgi:hypothetical protein
MPEPRDDVSDKLYEALEDVTAYLHVYEDDAKGLNVIIDGNLSHEQLATIVKVLDEAKEKPC